MACQQITRSLRQWLRESDEQAMIDAFPGMADRHGVHLIKAHRVQGTRHHHTVVHELVKQGKGRVLAFLAEEYGFDLDVQRPSDLCTPLHLAQWMGREGLVQELLRLGADPSLKNSYGEQAVESSAAPAAVQALLRAARTEADILRVVASRLDDFSGVEVAQAYSLLAKRTRDGEALRASSAFGALLAALRRLLGRRSEPLPASTWVSVLMGVVSLRSEEVLESLAAAAEDGAVDFGGWSHKDLGQTAWGLAKIRNLPQALRHCFWTLGDLLMPKLEQLSEEHLASVAWAFGQVRVRHLRLLKSLCARLCQLERPSPLTLSMAVWAHARVNATHQENVRLLAPKVCEAMQTPEASTQNCTLTAWCYAKLNVPSEALFSAFFRAAGMKLYEQSSNGAGNWAQIYFAYEFCCRSCPGAIRSLQGRLLVDLRRISERRMGDDFAQALGLGGRSGLERLYKAIDDEAANEAADADGESPRKAEPAPAAPTSAAAAPEGSELACLTLLDFSQCPACLGAAAGGSPALLGCRALLLGRGMSPELPSGAKLFVKPEQHAGAVRAAELLQLKDCHILVAPQLEELAISSIASMHLNAEGLLVRAARLKRRSDSALVFEPVSDPAPRPSGFPSFEPMLIPTPSTSGSSSPELTSSAAPAPPAEEPLRGAGVKMHAGDPGFKPCLAGSMRAEAPTFVPMPPPGLCDADAPLSASDSSTCASRAQTDADGASEADSTPSEHSGEGSTPEAVELVVKRSVIHLTPGGLSRGGCLVGC